jgi:long-chain fatty acid transport protein
VAALALGSGAAQAGGLLVQELANPRNGTAQAGQAAYAYDAATAFYNPAGMARLEEPELMIGLQPLWIDVEFDRDRATTLRGGDGGQQGGFVPGLGTFYARPLGERFAIGASVVGLAGGALDPDDAWAGRFVVTDLNLTVLSANPVLSYRVNDVISVGAGVSVNYARLDFELALPSVGPRPEGEVEMSGVDDVLPGWNLGVLFELSQRTRLGLTYRSELDFEMDGDFDVRNTPPLFQALGLRDGDVQAELPLPQFVRGSFHHQLTDEVALLGDVGWEDWSVNDFTPLRGPAGRTLEVPRKWRDTWHLGAGVEWRVAPRWLLQTGVGYDSSPVKERSTNLPDMPSDDQWRLSFGFVHDLTENVRIGLNYTYIDFGRSPIATPNDFGRLVGDYEDFEAHAVAFSVAF